MTQLRPCATCHRRHSECEKRDSVKSALRRAATEISEGAEGVRMNGSITFGCAARLEPFPIGARVRVRLFGAYCYNPNRGEFIEWDEHDGYVLDHGRGNASKITIWLDEETDQANRRIRLYPHLRDNAGGVWPIGDGALDIPAEEISRRFEDACKEQRFAKGGRWWDEERQVNIYRDASGEIAEEEEDSYAEIDF